METIKNSKVKYGVQARYAEKIRDQSSKSVEIEELNTFLLNKTQEMHIYQIAVRKFKIGNYLEAKNIFFFLSLCDVENDLYLKSYAGSLHALGDYEKAFSAYYDAYKKDLSNNIDCLYYSAVVMFELGEVVKARELFDEFIASVSGKEIAMMKIYEKAKNYLNMLNKASDLSDIDE